MKSLIRILEISAKAKRLLYPGQKLLFDATDDEGKDILLEDGIEIISFTNTLIYWKYIVDNSTAIYDHPISQIDDLFIGLK